MNSYIFVNGIGIYKLKANDSKINAALLCLSNFSNDTSADNMLIEPGLYRYVYDSVHYDSIDGANNLNIHKYLTAKNNIK